MKTFYSKAGREAEVKGGRPIGLGEPKGAKPVTPEQIELSQEVDKAFEESLKPETRIYQGPVGKGGEELSELEEQIKFAESLPPKRKTGTDA